MSAYTHSDEFMNNFAGVLVKYNVLPNADVVRVVTRLHELEEENVSQLYHDEMTKIFPVKPNIETKLTINQALRALNSIFYQASDFKKSSKQYQELVVYFEHLNSKITDKAWEVYAGDTEFSKKSAMVTFNGWVQHTADSISGKISTKSDYVWKRLAVIDDTFQNVHTW